MTKRYTFLFLLLWSVAASAQTHFTNQTRLLSPAQHYSGVAVAILDMDDDGRDDIVRMDAGYLVAIEHQSGPNQAFVHLPVGPVNSGSQWGMCAADVDNNGMGDILTGGYYDGVKILRANGDGSIFTTDEYVDPPTFVQGVNFADINNDGWLDAFVCHDDAEARIYGNNGDGTFTYQPDWIDFSTVPASDNSGNYGSVWSDIDNDGDLDLYIAHCRQGVNEPTDPRRINQLFWNNGDGTYTQDTTDLAHLRIGAQSWTADFGDIDNDGDFDCFITNHDVSSQILENDGAGHFTDITAAAGMLNKITGLPIEGVFRDFDNDGFVDILVAGSNQYLFHNNGDKTFTEVAGLFDTNLMESFAIGDLNHDGFQDIYGSYAHIYTTPSTIPDALWMNSGNNNHFYGLSLRGVQSNRSAVGTKVTLYSALGTQIREVRSGESYGISNSLEIHFGLGQITEIDSVVVHWPSGHVDKLYQPTIDQYANLQEGGCLLPSIDITTPDSTVFCTGQTAQLVGPAGYTAYSWSTGATTQHVEISTAGTYHLTVTSAEGCSAVSNALTTTIDPIETPTISVDGLTRFCAGGSVTLTASPANAYVWSSGDTTATISVVDAGAYTVTTKGLCSFFTSDTVQVEVLPALAPVAIGDTVVVNTAATLTASGTEPNWYSTPTAGSVLFTGSPFITPPLATTTPYWVALTTSYQQPNGHTGMTDHSGTTFGSSQYNGQIIFDCYKPCRLVSVKVYNNKLAERKIDLLSSDGTVLQSLDTIIPVGTSIIPLHFDLPVGNDLVLTTDESVNQQSLGSVGPQLRRSDNNVVYPYVLSDVLSLKNSNLGSDRYYYFYDWEIDFYGQECVSERVPVLAVVDTTLLGAQNPIWNTDWKLSPNPTKGPLQLDLPNFAGGKYTISVLNAQGAYLRTQQLQAPAGNLQWKGDFSNFPAGIYWLEVSGKQGILRKRVVVEK